MNERKLKQTLQSIGMRCFVDYFDLFSSDRFSNEEICEYLFNENDFTESSCRSRTRHAKRIFSEKKEIDALKIIEYSTRLPPYIKLQAAKLRAKLTLPPIIIDKVPITQKLQSFKAKDAKCKKLYCTTCGGLSTAIEKNLNSNVVSEIQEFLTSQSEEELYLLEDWYDFLIKYKQSGSAS